MSFSVEPITGIVVATLGGAAVGVERQRSGHAAGPAARFAGLRTFTLLGAVSGVAGDLAVSGHPMLAALVAGGAILLTVSAYIAASRRDIDATTEVAALVVIAAGLVAGVGRIGLAAGLIAVTVLLLAEKSRLHRLVERLDEPTLVAATRFAVMAVVILPLLPVGPYGPAPGVRPRELWLLVLLFSGLSFAGYVGRRMAGGAGHAVAGLLGGLVSSTSVTLTFARLSRIDREHGAALAAGAVAACTVMFARVAVAVAVLNRALVGAVGRYVWLPFLIGVAALLLAWRTARAPTADGSALRNPLQLRAAIEMALLFQAVLFAVHFAREWLGARGLIGSGFILGLTDVDALTISMARSATAGVAADLAARAIAVGVLANTLLKLTVALAVGRGRFPLLSGVPLALMALALGSLLLR